jgi:hypothetical protein
LPSRSIESKIAVGVNPNHPRRLQFRCKSLFTGASSQFLFLLPRKVSLPGEHKYLFPENLIKSLKYCTGLQTVKSLVFFLLPVFQCYFICSLPATGFLQKANSSLAKAQIIPAYANNGTESTKK